MMCCKMKKFILRDSTSKQFDDLVIFENDIDIEDVRELIENLKENNEDYTNEDVYNELDKLGNYSMQYLGWLEIVEY